MIRITIKTDRAKATFTKLMKVLTPENIDRVVDKASFQTLASVVKATPKKWFGQVRRSWNVQKRGVGSRAVRNDNKIMLFLDQGTHEHGPVTKKFLYIPLTRRAAAGWNRALKYGVDYILKKRVKGITAIHLVDKQAKIAAGFLMDGAKNLIRKAFPNG